jgi:hypothetical protein
MCEAKVAVGDTWVETVEVGPDKALSLRLSGQIYRELIMCD